MDIADILLMMQNGGCVAIKRWVTVIGGNRTREITVYADGVLLWECEFCFALVLDERREEHEATHEDHTARRNWARMRSYPGPNRRTEG